MAMTTDLYVIGEGAGSGLVKIGRARDARRRLREIQTGYPRELRLLHVEFGEGGAEKQLHRLLRGSRCRGEWFDFGDRDPVAEIRDALERVRAAEAAEGPRQQRRTPEQAEAGYWRAIRCISEGLGFDPDEAVKSFPPPPAL